jgi:sulfatase modifying factor 1
MYILATLALLIVIVNAIQLKPPPIPPASNPMIEVRGIDPAEDHHLTFVFGSPFHPPPQSQTLDDDEDDDDSLDDFVDDEDPTDVYNKHARANNLPLLNGKAHTYIPTHSSDHSLDDGVYPASTITIPPFVLQAHAVTNGEFKAFIDSTGYVTQAEKVGSSMVHDGDEWQEVEGSYWRNPSGYNGGEALTDHPVVHVSHRDAAEYCSSINMRLPGEREYEAATRFGKWEDNLRYGGFDYNHDAEEEEGDQDHPSTKINGATPGGDAVVELKPSTHHLPNEGGFHGLIGGVWEWCRGGESKESRILRGGSYLDIFENHRKLEDDEEEETKVGLLLSAASRSVMPEETTSSSIGFRCAREDMVESLKANTEGRIRMLVANQL